MESVARETNPVWMMSKLPKLFAKAEPCTRWFFSKVYSSVKVYWWHGWSGSALGDVQFAGPSGWETIKGSWLALGVWSVEWSWLLVYFRHNLVLRMWADGITVALPMCRWGFKNRTHSDRYTSHWWGDSRRLNSINTVVIERFCLRRLLCI